jgi:hypothetical protein
MQQRRAVTKVGILSLFLAGAAWAQADARAEVRAALEDEAPLPSLPLAFPAPDNDKSNGARVEQAAKVHANQASSRARAEALSHLPAAAQDAHNKLGTAGQSATGQARAEEAKKKGMKPPHLPEGPPHP